MGDRFYRDAYLYELFSSLFKVFPKLLCPLFNTDALFLIVIDRSQIGRLLFMQL